jgi:hypothetical protein
MTGGMRPLSPAVAELRWSGSTIAACGLVPAALGGGAVDVRAGGLGLAVAVLVLWVATGARAVRRAIRLAMPVRPRWGLEGTSATALRVLATQTAPLAALAVAATVVTRDRVDGAGSAAAGVLLGVGVCALLAAGRMRAAERALGRRLLREPRWGRLVDRRALFLEPESLRDRPSPPATTPWPAHRPPPRAPRAAMELEPANPPARHAVGVGVRTLRRAPDGQRPPGPSPPGS